MNGVDDRPTLSELLPPDASILDVDKEHIKNLPRFDAAEDAEVLLCASETGFDLGVKRLRKALERGDSTITLHGKQLNCLGFDTERTPTFRLGQPEQPVACLQLASHDLVVLFLLKNMRHIPASLQDLLEDPSVLKVGVALSEDTNALSRHAPGLTVRGLVDLAPLAEARFPSLTRRGLRGLVASLGGRRLSKHQSTASWGQRTYTPAMIRTANTLWPGCFVSGGSWATTGKTSGSVAREFVVRGGVRAGTTSRPGTMPLHRAGTPYHGAAGRLRRRRLKPPSSPPQRSLGAGAFDPTPAPRRRGLRLLSSVNGTEGEYAQK